ncbi:DUF6214 family protein, partial [Streptomyces sp. NPDC006129]|uniref:DUF6214 family protein n=1 Tax=Streptomyces sp. NPDC006129 TaxID=3155348 RepID=UPI0033A63F11
MTVRPAWEVRENDDATRWFDVRLAFTDGARVDALAVVTRGCVCVEEVRAQPALSLDDLAVLAGGPGPRGRPRHAGRGGSGPSR